MCCYVQLFRGWQTEQCRIQHREANLWPKPTASQARKLWRRGWNAGESGKNRTVDSPGQKWTKKVKNWLAQPSTYVLCIPFHICECITSNNVLLFGKYCSLWTNPFSCNPPILEGFPSHPKTVFFLPSITIHLQPFSEWKNTLKCFVKIHKLWQSTTCCKIPTTQPSELYYVTIAPC